MNRAIVIKLGGSAAVDPEPGLVSALVRIAGKRPTVIVHGGGGLVDQTLTELGYVPTKREGLRVTPPEQIGAVAGVLAGTVNTALVAALSEAASSDGLPGAVGLTLGDGVAGDVAQVRPHSQPALGCVGQPEYESSSDGRLLRMLLNGGWLPVVACIGSHGGGLLNVNADDAAAGVARAIGAECVLLLTDVPGVIGVDGEVVASTDEIEVERLIEQGVISGGMTPKVGAALRIADRVGCPVVIGHADDLDLLAGDPPGRGTVFRRSAGTASH